MAESRSQIAFFDLETTFPIKPGQGVSLLEVGAILVCPEKLVELSCYSTLLRPRDLTLIPPNWDRGNGISRAAVSSALTFVDVADMVFDLLNGRIWAGHNILRFDCPSIRDAFAEVNRPPPEPKGVIDSLALLTERFGPRAGNMKMATLATYFGLGQQTHRSLDDVRMNLEVLKYCATVLFLESSLPDILMSDPLVTPSTSQRTHSGGRFLPMEMNCTPSHVPTTVDLENQTMGEQVQNLVGPSGPEIDPFDMRSLSEEKAYASQVENFMEEWPAAESVYPSHPLIISESSSNSSEFLTPDEVFISSIDASWTPFNRGTRSILLLHKGFVLKLLCTNLEVRFGISTMFVDQAGRTKLSFVVDAPPSLCEVLDTCDGCAQSLFIDSGSLSDWRPLVFRKNVFYNFPTVRLCIPTIVTGDVARYGSEIFQKEAVTGTEQKLVFNKFDPAELESLLSPSTSVDAFFSLHQFDYQRCAGIRLVAEKLVIHSR